MTPSEKPSVKPPVHRYPEAPRPRQLTAIPRKAIRRCTWRAMDATLSRAVNAVDRRSV